MDSRVLSSAQCKHHFIIFCPANLSDRSSEVCSESVLELAEPTEVDIPFVANNNQLLPLRRLDDVSDGEGHISYHASPCILKLPLRPYFTVYLLYKSKALVAENTNIFTPSPNINEPLVPRDLQAFEWVVGHAMDLMKRLEFWNGGVKNFLFIEYLDLSLLSDQDQIGAGEGEGVVVYLFDGTDFLYFTLFRLDSL